MPLSFPAEETSLEDELSMSFRLSTRFLNLQEAKSPEFSEIVPNVKCLSAIVFATVEKRRSSSDPYDRPGRRIVADVAKNLERALSLALRARHSSSLRQVSFATLDHPLI